MYIQPESSFSIDANAPLTHNTPTLLSHRQLTRRKELFLQQSQRDRGRMKKWWCEIQRLTGHSKAFAAVSIYLSSPSCMVQKYNDQHSRYLSNATAKPPITARSSVLCCTAGGPSCQGTAGLQRASLDVKQSNSLRLRTKTQTKLKRTRPVPSL